MILRSMMSSGEKRNPGAIIIGIDCPRCGRRNTPAARIPENPQGITSQPRSAWRSGFLICFHCGNRLREESLLETPTAPTCSGSSVPPAIRRLQTSTVQHDITDSGFSEVAGTVFFDCPRCGRRDVSGTAFNLKEELVPFLIPWRTSWVICHGCGSRLYSRVDARTLATLPADQARKHIRAYVSLISKTLVVTALLLFFTPILGLCLGAAAVLANLNIKSWWRTWSWVALALGVLAHATFGILIGLGL
jgi:hypothetical protein